MNAAYPKVNFWDNLIPLRGGLEGPQLAGWTPRPPAKGGLGGVLYADQMIPVDAGVLLAADVYTPKAKGRYPAILVFSAYNKELQSSGAPTGTNETGSPSVFTSRGYAHIVLARRGMGPSQGESVIFFNHTDIEDHAKTIAWAAEQPWCDGNVVLFGTSYYGITQPQVAAKQPPALKGFFKLGYASIDEEIYEEGNWRPGRRLNDDENDQGNYWRFATGSIKIEKAVLYRYK